MYVCALQAPLSTPRYVIQPSLISIYAAMLGFKYVFVFKLRSEFHK